MKKTFYVILFFICSCGVNLFGQCDTSFFNFKRAIIEIASTQIDSIIKIDTIKKKLYFEFSDFTCFRYLTDDPRGWSGFSLFRIDSAFYLPPKPPFLIRNKITYNLDDKRGFEQFMYAGYFDTIDLEKNHTYSKLIEDPVEGWAIIERYYFYHVGMGKWDTNPQSDLIFFTIPIYTFSDRKIETAFFIRIELSGTTKNRIKILSVKNISL